MAKIRQKRITVIGKYHHPEDPLILCIGKPPKEYRFGLNRMLGVITEYITMPHDTKTKGILLPGMPKVGDLVETCEGAKLIVKKIIVRESMDKQLCR